MLSDVPKVIFNLFVGDVTAITTSVFGFGPFSDGRFVNCYLPLTNIVIFLWNLNVLYN
jgi:hypothetical protein